MGKLNRSINLRYAIGEIILIFIGITIAIWFNNWNENRKTGKLETKTLIELKNAINQDISDVQENVSGFSSRVKSYESVVLHLEDNLPLSDTFRDEMQNIRGLTTFISTTGPYETLKTRGLELITNDNLRLNISKLYDYDYEVVKTNERIYHEHISVHLKPMMLDRLDFSKGLEPKNYPTLLNDFKFKQVIYWALDIEKGMLRQYMALEKKAKSLIEEIDSELKQ